MQIEREFLASSNEKYVALHLTRTNYGFASEDADDIERVIEESQLTTKTLEIVVPGDDSVVVMLVRIINEEGTGEEVEEIKTAPPGQTSVTVSLKENNTYWLYIVSKLNQDGYIGKDLIVRPLANETDRLELSVDSAEQSIDLSVEGRLIQSVDEDDPTQWYNYQGHYTGPLVWNAPDIIAQPGSGAWLLQARDILSQFKRLFEIYNVSLFSANNKQDILAVFKIMSDIAEFMKRYKNDIDESTDGNLAPYWDFLDNNFLEDSEGRRGYQYYNSNYHEWVAGASVLADYIPYGGAGWNDGWGHGLYVGVARRINAPQDFDAYRARYTQDNEIFGNLDGLIVNNDIDSTETYPNSTTITYEDGSAVTTEGLGESIRAFVRRTHGELEEQLREHQIDIFDRNATAAAVWWDRIRPIAQTYYTNVWPWLNEAISDVEIAIVTAGESIWDVDATGTTVSSVAHEATLQNIRFVKNALQEVQNNMWTTLINSNALMFRSIQNLDERTRTQNTKVNTLTNISSAPIQGRDVDVFYTDDISTPGNWRPLTTTVIDNSDVVKTINLNSLRTVGQYAVMVRPAQIDVNVVEANGDVIRVTTDSDVLDNYQQKNAFYGWSIIFRTPNGDILSQGVVTSSLWGVEGQRLQVSPNIEGRVDFNDDIRATIISNQFTPVLINVNIVDHNALTLSYNMYAKKEFNTQTGKCTIYDYNGNVYKELSIGKRATDETDRDIVEFRDPIGE